MPGRTRKITRTFGDPLLEAAVTRRDQAARLDALGVPDTVAGDLLAPWATWAAVVRPAEELPRPGA